MITNAVKRFLLRVMPGPAGIMQTLWQRRHTRRFERSLGLPGITQAFVARHGLSVHSGPFAGMQYVSSAVGSAFVPKLLGSYESELHDVIEQIAAASYSIIVDIGCAEGYYAIGLALRLPEARVYAFDTDPRGRKLCAMMAGANNVSDRVIVGGKCDPERLSSLINPQTLIVCDCEGYEIHLLRPDLVPQMNSAAVLVEFHECVTPGITKTLLKRFEATHDILLITSVARNSACYPVLNFLSEKQQVVAVSEFRPGGQQWAYMTPKTSCENVTVR